VILLISVSVFLATSLAVFAAFRWAGIRRGALENRLREAVSPAGAAPARSLPRFSGWVSKIRKAFGPPERESGEIASRVTRDVPSGVRLLLFQAGYRTDAAERACLWVRIAEEFRLGSPVLSEEFDIVNREMAAGKMNSGSGG